MNRKLFGASVAAVTLSAAFFTMAANAAAVSCAPNPLSGYNYMEVDSAYVSSCLDSGSGNINGNTKTDDFLPFDGWVGIEDGNSFTQSQGADSTTGTFTIDSSLWSTWGDIAIGFKFGTGDNPDEWFVYQLVDFISSGDWTFFNVGGQGGGLSHIQLYGRGTPVPEPGTLALLGLGIMGLAAARRRKQI